MFLNKTSQPQPRFECDRILARIFNTWIFQKTFWEIFFNCCKICLDDIFSWNFGGVDELDDGDDENEEPNDDDEEGFLSLKQNVQTFKSLRFTCLSGPINLYKKVQ